MTHFLKSLLIFITLGLPSFAQDVRITELKSATVGKHYQEPAGIHATGTFPFHLAVTTGTLPQGLSLGQDGTISGDPQIVADQVFAITVTDSEGKPQQGVFRLRVKPEREPVTEQPAGGVQADAAPSRLALSTPVVAFGAQQLGSQSDDHEVQITNNTGADLDTPPMVVLNNAQGGQCDDSCDFVITENGCQGKLVKLASCHVKLAFAPRHVSSQSTQTLQEALVMITAARDSATIRLSGIGRSWGSPVTRLVAGFDVSGASSADPQQQFFVEAMLTAPLGRGEGDPLNSRTWLFANPKIMSVPQAGSAVSGLNINADFFNPILNGKTTDIVQAFDLKFGGEILLKKPRDGVPFWAEFPNTKARLAVALVAMGGFLTPFSTPNRTSQVFVINDSIKAQFPGAVADPTKKNIAFVTPDRSRFLRSYYGGLRFKTYYFSSRDKDENGQEALYTIFPGTIDLTVGQDESVTGGSLRGPIFRIEGVYPLPFNPAFHIFGGAYLALSRNTNSTPLNLQVPSPVVASSDPSVFLQTVSSPNRDRFHIGLGVDLVQLFNRKPASKPNGSQ